ncbi:MAG: PilZ domain-containing protein [Candidatus Aureabacteria bacterium]|nr:PilZ domain-containing protein [Candidatus Auribacterota bacterium]
MGQKPSERSERRKHERLMADLPVRLTIIDESTAAPGLKFYGGRVSNLSKEGIAIETYVSSGVEVLRNGQKVSAEITLPDSHDAITMAGEATWGTKIHNPLDQSAILRVGLKISEISSPDAERFRAHIDQQLAGLQ